MEAVEWSGVGGTDLIDNWGVLSHFIQKALDRTTAGEDYDADFILEECVNKNMQCWVLYSEEAILGVVITQILVYPKRKVLSIPFAGGEKNHLENTLYFLDILKAYAKEHDCKVIRGYGRKGWEKVLNPDHVCIEFDIEVLHESLH